jgi:serine phosphatase RsbU (regulator of sigma subunit)
MPVLSGDEFCRQVKGSPATRDIYFVLVSAMDGTVSKIGGLNLGADDMIAKPFHAQEVMAKVESAFRIIAMQKEIKVQNQTLTRFQDRVNAELELAARLQIGLLPQIPGDAAGIHYTHRYLPAEGIGGDIYAINPLADGTAAVMIADVSGHGVTAALISAMVKTSFESQVRNGGTPLDWAVGMNRDLARNTLEDQFATALIAHIQPQRDEIHYVVAGHVAPFKLPEGSRGGLHRPEILHGKGFMLGLAEDLPFKQEQATFCKGDRLILYTDGLVEVEREDRRLLGEEGLMKFCAELPASADEAAGLLVAKAKAFNDPVPFNDDVTLVVLDRVN